MGYRRKVIDVKWEGVKVRDTRKQRNRRKLSWLKKKKRINVEKEDILRRWTWRKFKEWVEIDSYEG